MKNLVLCGTDRVIAVYDESKSLTLEQLRSPEFLRGDLRDIKIPFDFEILCRGNIERVLSLFGKKEISVLLDRLSRGQLDGTANLSEHRCLIGTLMFARGETREMFTSRSELNPGLNLPAVQWFLQIGPGDTPENNYFAQKAEDWCVQFFGRFEGIV